LTTGKNADLVFLCHFKNGKESRYKGVKQFRSNGQTQAEMYYGKDQLRLAG
jgi:hypothetical protein